MILSQKQYDTVVLDRSFVIKNTQYCPSVYEKLAEKVDAHIAVRRSS